MLAVILMPFYSYSQQGRQMAADIPEKYCKSLEAMCSYISSNYNDSESRLWCLYCWEARHISYDLSQIHVQKNFKDEDELAEWTLENRRGVCSNFARLFCVVAVRLGIECYFVEGYSSSNLSALSDSSHAWCACIVNGSPYIIDPTWGEGYMAGSSSVRKFNGNYFMIEPSSSIKQRMPLDPVFQFSEYPIRYEEFDRKNADNTKSSAAKFSWRDTLECYSKMSHLGQMESRLGRMMANGEPNDVVRKNVSVLKHNIGAARYNSYSDRFNELSDRLGNVYSAVSSKRRQTYTKNVLLEEVDKIGNMYDELKTDVAETEFYDVNITKASKSMLAKIEQTKKSIARFRKQVVSSCK